MLLWDLNLHCLCHTTMNESATVISRGYKSHHNCLKLAGWSFLHALVRVVHSDWLKGSNFWFKSEWQFAYRFSGKLVDIHKKKRGCWDWKLLSMNPPSTEVSSKSYTNLSLFFYAKKGSSPANKSHKLS